MRWCPAAIYSEPVEEGVGIRLVSSAQHEGVRYMADSLVSFTLEKGGLCRTHLTEDTLRSERGVLSKEEYEGLLASCFKEFWIVGSYSVGYLSSFLARQFDSTGLKPFVSQIIKEPSELDAQAYFLGMEHASSRLRADPNAALFLKSLSKPAQGPEPQPEKPGNLSMYS